MTHEKHCSRGALFAASSRTDVPKLVKALRRAVEMIITCSGDVILLNQRRAERAAILTQAKQ